MERLNVRTHGSVTGSGDNLGSVVLTLFNDELLRICFNVLQVDILTSEKNIEINCLMLNCGKF